jgi:hypothetical protein
MSQDKNLTIDEFFAATKENKITYVLREAEKLSCRPKYIFSDCIIFKTLYDYTLFLFLLIRADVHPLDFPQPVACCSAKGLGNVSDSSYEYFSEQNPFEFVFKLKE